MQGAIDAAPNGATILVEAGVYEPFRVEGKRLRIIGSDEGRSEIASFSVEVPLATYADGGGGELKNVYFHGGSCAVCGARDDSALPSALSLKDVTATEGYRGIFGAFSSLSAKNVDVFATRWHGVSITHVGVKLTLGDIEVHDVGGVGLVVFNGGAGDMTIGGHFHDNAKGGIHVVGHNGDVDLVFVGVFNSGSFVALGSDTFDSNAADLGHEPGLPFTWDDLGNLVCGDNIGTPSETLHACQDLSLDIQPPDPTQP